MSERSASPGTLYLVPVPLGDNDPRAVLPSSTLDIARQLDSFVAESSKAARKFLKAIGHPRALRDIAISVLDEHSGDRDVESLLTLLLAGNNCGLVSEAGCPAVADPGAALVRRAHACGVPVVPLIGPSSILLALMASGMDGQRFAFHGYLPVDAAARAKMLRALESRAADETQIFIETPYRNAAMVQAMLVHCRRDTLLCIAVNLTLPSESVLTRSIADWTKQPPDLARRPAVYLLWRRSP